MPVFAPRILRESASSKTASVQHDGLKASTAHPAIGNQALLRMIQRTITIDNYNTRVGGLHDDQDLDIAAVRESISRAVNGPSKQTILNTLTTLNAQNYHAADVHTLANDLCQGIADQAVIATVRKAVGDTIVNPKQGERDLYKKLIDERAVLSYQKAHPGSIGMTDLGRAVANAPQVVRLVTELHNSLQTPPRWVLERSTDVSEWAFCMNPGAQLRTPHGNGAGWLPNGSYTTDYTQHNQTVNTAVTDMRAEQTDVNTTRARQRKLAGMSDHALYRDAAIKHLTPQQRRYLAWGAYAESNHGAGSPYIEFGVPGEADGRVVFDFTTGDFYFTVHYNWHQGLNPFFRIT